MFTKPAFLPAAFFFFIGLCSLKAQISSQSDSSLVSNPFGRKYPPRIYRTQKIAGIPPVIDGRLDDSCWLEGEWHGDFLQQIPVEGAKASAETKMKILYDEKNIYFAFRAYDHPERIHRYFSRRDDFVGDMVGVCLDSYADKQTGFEFDLTAGGGKIDLILMNGALDYTSDMNWDAVWKGKTAQEDSAWTAEFQVPLSQLRYGLQEEQVWGMHAWRWIDWNQEEDQWSLVPRINTGRMYNIGELHGIRNLRRFRHIEILPYVLGRTTTDPKEAGNPYATGTASIGSAGLDAKIGLSSDFTLDATLNPDFGQVEADPSVMNLTAYETFFSEKRPFFLEGKNILEFNLGDNMLFYTRRIGHKPTYSPELRDREYIKMPENTDIINAVKITGKNRDGLSLGILQSLAARESAQISYMGEERNQTVEPFSNYFVGRIQKDWNKGNTSLGGIVTSAHRWIEDRALDFMTDDAVTGGLNIIHYFRNRSYVIDAKTVISRTSGSPEALLNLQTDPAHYFQRPGTRHLEPDSSAALISGYGGSLLLGRVGNGKLRFSNQATWYSPGLELNHLGYLQQADIIMNQTSVGYSEPEPAGIIRDYSINLGQYFAWDFGGLRTDAMTSLSVSGDFSNLWYLSSGVNWVEEQVDTRMLRGGSAVRRSPFVCMYLNSHTDYSRKFALSAGIHRHIFQYGGSDLFEVYPGLVFRLSNALSLSGDLTYSGNIDDIQYVSTKETESGIRTLIGRIKQKTLGVTFHINYHITPDFSIQYYASPFISAGNYSDFKKVTSPLADNYGDRFHRFEAGEITFRSEDNEYDVQEKDGTVYSFDNPDFSFRQLRSNLVVRWEYGPGSVLYIVWAQQRTSYEFEWEESIGGNFSSLGNANAHNVFMAKMSYWFSL